MEYGCIGEKLAHSFSKEIHAKLFDYKYELKEIAPEKLEEFMLSRDFKGINVTIPYKQAVIPYLDFISDEAKEIGAVNTIVNRDGRLYGYNTDFLGMKALIEYIGIDIKDKRVYVLGSGGTSKTAAAVAKAMGAGDVKRVSRSGKDGCITYEQATAEDIEVIINTTPCGMYPHIYESPIDITDPCTFPNLIGVADAVYNPLSSKLICDAEEQDILCGGGLYMLIAQAVFAAERFTDTAVGKDRIYEIFKEMVLDKTNIVLIGMPASGKTTIGKMLSEKMGRELIDTDAEIVKQAGKSIPDIFNECGEEGFRDIEARIIEEVSLRQGVIIATGGGAILRKRNVELLRENGRLYFLDRPLDMLITTDDRPLASNREALTKRYNERYGLYCEYADATIDSSKHPEECVSDIERDFKNENTCN